MTQDNNPKRPVYERESDRTNEEAVAKQLADHLECDYQASDKLACFDYTFQWRKGSAKLVAEIKCRSQVYDPFILSKAKWDKLVKFLRHGTLVLLAYAVPDRIYYQVYHSDPQYPVHTAGRTDRNDPHDREPCIHIPLGEFESIKRESK
jgi:hypothetical protein